MTSFVLVAVLIGLVLIAGISNRVRNTIITLPMLYVLFGLGVGLLFTDQVRLSIEDPLIELIATLTLMLVLATDASRIHIRRLRLNYTLPLRLLVIGLPLTIILGAVLAALLFDLLDIWEAAVLAVILAPTDASLGQSVVSNPRVPVRIRQALNIESGLNDGIAMPFLILAISLAISDETTLGSGIFLSLAATQIIFGAITGAVLGYLGARYIHWGHERGWMTPHFQKICWLALVILTFLAAEWLQGNGFIAAFVFGIISGTVVGPREMKSLDEYSETENTLLMLATYTIFGMVLLLPALEQINLTVVLYALLSLTVVRMAPVALSLIGTKLRPVTVLFMGWFGPRGIASILYVLTAVGVEELTDIDTIYQAVMLTVFFSVIAHGISAAPLANWYGKHMATLDKKGAVDHETKPVPEIPTRAGTVAAGSVLPPPAN